MGRELQKRKNRSSVPKISRQRKRKLGVQKIKTFGNPVIANNWNKSETLSQNYRRLGLSSRLNGSSWCASTSSFSAVEQGVGKPSKKLQPGEARIKRDENANVISVEHALTVEKALDIDSGNEREPAREDSKTGVLGQLEEMANRPSAKAERRQSDRDKEWIERLISKYGTDFKRMSRDRKLNPFQETEGQIRKRYRRWEEQTQGITRI